MRHKNSVWILSIFLTTLLLVPFSYAEDGGVASLRESSKAFASVERKVSLSVVFIKVEQRTKINAPTSAACLFNLTHCLSSILCL